MQDRQEYRPLHIKPKLASGQQGGQFLIDFQLMPQAVEDQPRANLAHRLAFDTALTVGINNLHLIAKLRQTASKIVQLAGLAQPVQSP